MQPFHFRHFTIRQDLESTLRVGTDAMLLGAWVQPGAAVRILDIGTGTGEAVAICTDLVGIRILILGNIC